MSFFSVLQAARVHKIDKDFSKNQCIFQKESKELQDMLKELQGSLNR